MNPAPFRSAREAFLRFPSRLVNFFFSIFRKFLFGIAGSFSPPRNSFLRKFRATCQDFFQFRDTFASLAVRLNRRRRTLRGSPPFVKLFVESFLFFLIEGGRGTLSLARKGGSLPPQTPPSFPQTRFILVSVTARRCRGFPLFAVPRRRGRIFRGVTKLLTNSRQYFSLLLPHSRRQSAPEPESGSGTLCRKITFFFLSMLKKTGGPSLPPHLRETVIPGMPSAFPPPPILLNKARLGRGGGLGEGRTFVRQPKVLPSPNAKTNAKPAALDLQTHICHSLQRHM